MRRVPVALALSLLLAAAAAHAEPLSPRAASAEHLFGEGRRLVSEGHVAEGCAKLAQSQSLDPSAGTLLNLADCYEQDDKLASAWLAFREAARASSDRHRDDWARLATKRALVLEPRLSRLVIDARSDGRAEVLVDGHVVDRRSFGAPLPLDRGSHALEARADGQTYFTTTVVIAREGELLTVHVDEPSVVQPKVPAREAAKPEMDVASRDRLGTTQGKVGLVVAGVGTLGLLFAGGAALVAKSARDDAGDACSTYPRFDPTRCGPSTETDNDRARTFAAAATVSAVAGGALLAVGGVLFFTAPSRGGASTAGQGARLGLSPSGATFGGVF